MAWFTRRRGHINSLATDNTRRADTVASSRGPELMMSTTT